MDHVELVGIKGYLQLRIQNTNMKKKKQKSPMQQVRKPVPRETQIIKSKKQSILDELGEDEIQQGYQNCEDCGCLCPCRCACYCCYA